MRHVVDEVLPDLGQPLLSQNNDHRIDKGAEDQQLQHAREQPAVEAHEDVGTPVGEADAEIVPISIEPGGHRLLGFLTANMTAVDDAVTEAVVDGIVERGVQGGPLKGLPQQGFQQKGVKGVVEVGDKGVGGLLSDRLHDSAVTAHALDAVHHLRQGDDHTVIEFPLPKVHRLPEPDELQDQRAENGKQARQDEQSDAASRHGSKLRVRGAFHPVGPRPDLGGML